MVSEMSEVGRRIAQARERARMTQQELGNRVSMERSAIAKIESGRRGVGALELLRIAEAVGQRLEWLLRDAPDAVIAHRTRLDPDLDVAAIDTLLETLARQTEFVTEIVPAITGRGIEHAEVPRSGNESEALAATARDECGLIDVDPVRGIADVVGRVGLIAFSAPLGPDTADAASTLLNQGAVAIVNSSHAVGRRRLALAHELGHYLVRDDYTVDWRVADHNDSDRTEILLDRFARAFLAPPEAFSRFWRDCRQAWSVRTSAILIGSEFQIDMATIARRLHELSLATGDEVSEVRGVRTKKADILEHGLLAPTDLEGTTVPTAYAQAVLSLFEKQKLSADRAVGLLLGTFDHDDLPTLPPRHKDEIWSLL